MGTVKKMGLVAAVLIVVAAFFLPAFGQLSGAAVKTICLAIAFLILAVTEALPISVICWVTLGLMPVIGAAPGFADALSGFANPVVFFILASFGIAAAFTEIPLSKRMMVLLLRRFGKSVKSMLFAIMLCAALLSSIVSNVPTCALFMAIGLSFLELYDDPEAKKRTGRAFMIGIPIASMVGGMMTPAGSSINLLAIQLLEQATGETITFVQWMAVGIPLTILVLPVAWLLIVKVYKPAEISPDMVKSFIATLDVPPKLSGSEIKVLVLTAVMLVLWILSSWFRGINVMVVALLGCCALFMPGIRVLKWETFIKKNVNLDSFFLVGTVLSLGNLMVSNGVSEWIITLLPTAPMSLPMLIAFTVTLIFGMLIIIPVAPSLVTFMAVPLITLATSMGYGAPVVILALALTACNCYLLPLDTVTLLTYGTGYYAMMDMPKSTLLLQVYIIAVMTAVISLASGVMNII